MPGIAGIVLTMGMAVDANVLIYERIREEQRNGRAMMASIDTGFRRAMATIIDANMTHLIASLILFELGSGPVRGFAVTLGVGIITSFFTAVMVTRLIVVDWLNWRRPKTLTHLKQKGLNTGRKRVKLRPRLQSGGGGHGRVFRQSSQYGDRGLRARGHRALHPHHHGRHSISRASPSGCSSLRWLHIICGVMWIGLLWYFNFVADADHAEDSRPS